MFARLSIVNADCDWCMSGVSIEQLEKKVRVSNRMSNIYICFRWSRSINKQHPKDCHMIRIYFIIRDQQRKLATGHLQVWTDDDIRLLYHRFLGGETMSLERLFCVWQQMNLDSSRLLLVVDAEHAYHWLSAIACQRNIVCALQTAKYGHSTSQDPETAPAVGDLTRIWAECSDSADSIDQLKSMGIRSAYAVTYRWTDFDDFSAPDPSQVLNYWQQILPRVTHGCLSTLIYAWSLRQSATSSCRCIARICRRWRQRLWPTNQLDTGHGFCLLNSHR